MSADPYTLYLLWGGDRDRLLYVGQTTRWPRRLHEHASSKAWWHQVTDAETHPYPDRISVCQAECTLIDQLEPLHNRPYTAAQRLMLNPENRRLRQEAVARWEKEQWERFANVTRRRRGAAVTIAAVEDTKLSPVARLVNVWLSSWAGPLPGSSEAAQALGIDVAAASEAYADLLAAGYFITDGEDETA